MDVSGRQRSGEERRTREEEGRGENVKRGDKRINREERRIGAKRVVCVFQCARAYPQIVASTISQGHFFLCLNPCLFLCWFVFDKLRRGERRGGPERS